MKNNKEEKYRFLIIDILDILIDVNEILDSIYISKKINEFQDKLKNFKSKKGGR